jgi:hypothetical protein
MIDLQLSNTVLMWIPTIDPYIMPNCVGVIFKIRYALSSTMFLVHTDSDNTFSISGGYVCDNKSHAECGLRLVQSLLGIRLERQNHLVIRQSSTILLDAANPIHHHTYQGKFWLEELDIMIF